LPRLRSHLASLAFPACLACFACIMPALMQLSCLQLAWCSPPSRRLPLLLLSLRLLYSIVWSFASPQPLLAYQLLPDGADRGAQPRRDRGRG
jgi:hypothetical protein